MPEMMYNAGDLRTGQGHADEASTHSASAASALDVPGGASPFGNVSGSDAFHGSVQTARQHHQTSAGHGAHNLTMAGRRAGRAASLGDENTVTTSKVAPRSEHSATVARGM